MEWIEEFLKTFIPLLIIMDPVGNMPIFTMFTFGMEEKERDRVARTASILAGAILVVFAVAGEWVLRLFGVSIAAFEIAGGIIFFIYSLQMLKLIPAGLKSTASEEAEWGKKTNVAFVPLATPLLAGPGAITAVLVRRQDAYVFQGTLIVLLAITLCSLCTYVIFRKGSGIIKLLGPSGVTVLERILGLILSVIAIQYVISGILKLR